MSEDELILTHILECSRTDLLLKKPKLSDYQQEQFQAFKRRRQEGEPLQYILGSWDFHGLRFKVDPRVLVPRPETEILVELAIKGIKGRDILDLGTGSGNIAVTLGKFLPYTQVTAVDISIDAIAVAVANAQYHGVEGRIEFINADMLDYLEDSSKQFDLIVSNPPYIPTLQMADLPKDVKQEPVLALDGGRDGLDFYESIIKYSPRLLRTGACLMMEFGDGQGNAVRELIQAQESFINIEIIKDLAGKERVISAIRG